MIRVHIEPDSVTLSGHAGAAPYGQDIVCAAVSVLTINLYNSIRTLTGDLVTASVTEDQTVIGWEHLSEAGRVLVDAFFLGICSIAEPSGKHIFGRTGTEAPGGAEKAGECPGGRKGNLI